MELTYSLDEIDQVARRILEEFPEKKCFAFFAEMGSGKTTLIKTMCKSLGVSDHVTSPTYSIVNEYLIDQSKEKVFHMDWYRLKNVEEAIEAGVQDILENGEGYCLIEWPEIALALLPADYQPISIKITSDNSRTIKS